MNNDIKKQWEYVKAHRLGLDDTFQFGCKGCGKCCKHRDDILLSAYDLYRISKYFNRTPAEILDHYCEAYIGSGSNVLIVRTKPIPPYNACPFQRGKKCSVHPAKPLVCATYPLGRAFHSDYEGPIYFLRSEITCGNMERTSTVRQWLGDFALPEAESAGSRWNDVIGLISMSSGNSWSRLNSTQRERLEKSQKELLYLAYDTELPFLPQFESNAAQLMLTVIREVGTDVVPVWLPISESMSADEKALLLVRKSYRKYISDWCESRHFNLEDWNEETESFPDGSCYVCFSEFQGCEYQDELYMEQLLDKEDFELWNKILKQERNN